jgi:hypothetical protein
MMGTPAEKETTQFILGHLKGSGLAPFTEEIQWSNAYVIARKLMSSTLIIWLLIYNFVLRVDGMAGGILSVMAPVLAIFSTALLGRLIRNDTFSFRGEMSVGKNVICDISPSQEKDQERILYFTAHTDSVASSMPKLSMPLTIGGYLLFLVSTLIALTGGILKLSGSGIEILSLILLIISCVDGLAILISLFAKRVDNSPGAIDNGSGSAILLDLADHFQENRPENLTLRFIFCTAEEWGLYGSKGYVRNHREELLENVDRDLLINVDMVGSELALVKKGGLLIRKPLNKKLNSLINEVAEKTGIELRGFSTPLANNSDHAPFRKLKMETAFFLSKKDTKKIHKPLDTIEGVDSKKMDDAVNLLKSIVKELDQD